MGDEPEGRVTQLLNDWSGGREAALANSCHSSMTNCGSSRSGICAASARTHVATHGARQEAFLRLVKQQDVEWQSRSHFLALASQLMRRILVDHAPRPACVETRLRNQGDQHGFDGGGVRR